MTRGPQEPATRMESDPGDPLRSVTLDVGERFLLVEAPQLDAAVVAARGEIDGVPVLVEGRPWVPDDAGGVGLVPAQPQDWLHRGHLPQAA